MTFITNSSRLMLYKDKTAVRGQKPATRKHSPRIFNTEARATYKISLLLIN